MPIDRLNELALFCDWKFFIYLSKSYLYTTNPYSSKYILLRTPLLQNIVGLDDGLAPDQRQAITKRNGEIYTYSGCIGYADKVRIGLNSRLFNRIKVGSNCKYKT